jgi:hypothetical protein
MAPILMLSSPEPPVTVVDVAAAAETSRVRFPVYPTALTELTSVEPVPVKVRFADPATVIVSRTSAVLVSVKIIVEADPAAVMAAVSTPASSRVCADVFVEMF